MEEESVEQLIPQDSLVPRCNAPAGIEPTKPHVRTRLLSAQPLTKYEDIEVSKLSK